MACIHSSTLSEFVHCTRQVQACARTHLVEDGKLVADGALGDVGEGGHEAAHVAVQLQAAQLIEGLQPQRRLHPLHHLAKQSSQSISLAGSSTSWHKNTTNTCLLVHPAVLPRCTCRPIKTLHSTGE